MRYTLKFWCSNCKRTLEADFEVGDERDFVHCDCGVVYLVTRPYVADVALIYKKHVVEAD